jgi:hypothetical protein
LPVDPTFITKAVGRRGFPYWRAHIERIVKLARERHIDEVRRDWRQIADIMRAAKGVDWNAARPLTDLEAKAEPPSWAERKARRTRPRPPPDILNSNLWWDRDAGQSRRWRDQRAIAVTISFGILLLARRLSARPSMSGFVDWGLATARQWIDGLPRILDASA